MTSIVGIIFLVCSQIATAANCDNVKKYIERSSITGAISLINNNYAPKLCFFYVAQAYLKSGERENARSYIKQIKNILDKREDFYYDALYLKLLLLDAEELTPTEISSALTKLNNNRWGLYDKLIREKKTQFRDKRQQLCQNPFQNTQIKTDSPYIADMLEKTEVDKILGLIRDIIDKDNLQMSKENSQAILNKFQVLKTTCAQISDTKEILVKHSRLVSYYEAIEVANNDRKSLPERLDNAKNALEVATQYLSHYFPNQDNETNLVAEIELQIEVKTLKKLLAEVEGKSTEKVDEHLTSLVEYRQKNAIINQLQSANKELLKAIWLYADCQQNNFSSCNTLSQKTSSVSTENIINFAKKRITSFAANKINTIIKNDTALTLRAASQQAQSFMTGNSVNIQLLPQTEQTAIKGKVETLKKLEKAYYKADKDWVTIAELNKALGANGFTELEPAAQCSEIQSAISSYKKQNNQTAIQLCHTTFKTAECPDDKVRLKLIEAVAKKIITSDKGNEQIANALTVLISKKFDSEEDNHCQATQSLITRLLSENPEIQQSITLALNNKYVAVDSVSNNTRENFAEQNGDSQDLSSEHQSSTSDNPSGVNEEICVCQCRCNCTYSWNWEKSALNITLVFNNKLEKHYTHLSSKQNQQRTSYLYPYFRIGMDVWKGKKSSQDYRYNDSTSLANSLAKAVETLRDGIDDSDALQSADFDTFYNVAKNKRKPDRAHFVGAFFQGLWHLERQEYEDSYDAIRQAYCKYKYTELMNEFSREMMQAISDLGDLKRKPKKKCSEDLVP